MASSPVPKDSPVMIAWEAYKAGESYANTRNWALHEKAVDGSLWAAFFAGHEAAHSVIAGKVAELTEALEAIADHAVQLRMGTDDWFELDEIEQVARAALAPYPERRHD